jgi:hypothetical protein
MPIQEEIFEEGQVSVRYFSPGKRREPAGLDKDIFPQYLQRIGEPGYRSRYSDWLGAGRLRGRSSSPGRVKNFLHVVQTSSGRGVKLTTHL